MKLINFRSFLFILLPLLIFNSAHAQQNSLSLTAPDNGETWQAGTSHDVTWGSGGTISNVKIEYSADNGSTWITVIASTPNESQKYTWTIPGTLSANCLVKISDAADPTVFSQSTNVFSITAPSAPANLDPVNGKISVPTNVQLKWDIVTGATSYKIQISTKADFSENPINQTTTSNSYTTSKLTANTVYYWQVSAYVGDASSVTGPYSFTTQPLPTTLKSPNEGTVGVVLDETLQWNEVTGISNYSLEIADNQDFNNKQTIPVTDATSTQVPGLKNYTTYYWRVSAVGNGGSTSTPSAVRSFTTIHAAPVLTSPDNSSAQPKTKITYKWEAVTAGTAAITYELQIANDGNFKTGAKTYPKTSDIEYPAADYLEYGKTYFWHVRAIASGSNTTSNWSDPFSFTVGTPTATLGGTSAAIVMDHLNGRVAKLTYLLGSNKQLLDTTANKNNKTGLGRITGEQGTKLASWSETNATGQSGSCEYNYENISYGSKKITVAWDDKGITVTNDLSIAPGKKADLSAAWQPGGDTGPGHDHVLYASDDNTINKYDLTYPASTLTLPGSKYLLEARYDDRYDEYFGFINSEATDMKIQDGQAALGPQYSFSNQSASVLPKTVTFTVKKKDDFFAKNKYILVTSPSAGDRYVDKTPWPVEWESYGVASTSTVDIKFSTDGGNSWLITPLTTGKDINGSFDVIYDLSNGPTNENCMVQVVEHSGSTAGKSGVFSIVKDATSNVIISISKDLTGAPTSTVDVPIIITPGTTGSSVNSFDIRLNYDKSTLTYIGNTIDNRLKNWVVDATPNTTTGYVQVSGFNDTKSGGVAISSAGKLITLTFKIGPGAEVGRKTSLTMEKLSASDDLAKPLTVLGSDGAVTYNSRVSGYIRYIMTKKGLAGSKLIHYSDTRANVSEDFNVSNGYFDFDNKIPGNQVVITPDAGKKLPDQLSLAVSAIDARKAFDGRDGGPVKVSDLQKVAADVNDDGAVNSTDAYAILMKSTGAALDASNFKTNWIFVDSAYAAANPGNWPAFKRSITIPILDDVKSKQSFWAMVRGDVDGSYDLSGDVASVIQPSDNGGFASALSKETFDPDSPTYSVPSDLCARPGDTLSLPLNIALNGKNIGAFNASIKFNSKLLSYTGKFSAGNSLPVDNGWTVSTYYDTASQKLNIAATDFSGALDPITKNGTIGLFKFVVNSNAAIGETSDIELSQFVVADSKLAPLGINAQSGRITVSTIPDGEGNNGVVTAYELYQNYPNPFNPTTTIAYALPKDSKVTVEIYNSIGQKVTELFNGIQANGYHKLEWNARNFASGIYLFSIKASSLSDGSNFKQFRKMVLMK